MLHKLEILVAIDILECVNLWTPEVAFTNANVAVARYILELQ